MAALPKPVPPRPAKSAEDKPGKAWGVSMHVQSKKARQKREEEKALEQQDPSKAKGKSRTKHVARSTRAEARRAAARAAKREREARAREAALVRDSAPDGMDPSWWALGRKLRFLPVWSGLAAVELHDPARGKPTDLKGLPERVRTLTSNLMDEGYPFPFVVVPASGLPDDLVRDVAHAGGQVVEVPETYASLDEVERIALLAERQPDPRRDGPREKVGLGISPPDKPFDESRFRGPSSRLSTRQIEAWAERLSDSSARPSDLD